MGTDLSEQATGPESEPLRSRIARLEAERDDYAQRYAELFVLQQIFSTINSTLEINEIPAMVLRGLVEALKFQRAILFELDRDDAIVRRLQCDFDGTVSAPSNSSEFRESSTLHDVARGDLQLAYGSTQDHDAPLDDGNGSYCIAPLVSRNVVRGLLYVDGAPTDGVSETQLRALLDFASQAAIALENARLYQETLRMAHTDSLTGIPNRRAFEELLERELHTSSRYRTPFAFVILDLDDLKKINDTHGHGEGDAALKRFAKVLRKNARKGDILARYAGDEFVLVMTQSERTQTTKGVERIQAALRADGLSSSMGIAMFPVNGTDAQSLFVSADEALYGAKAAGKNQYRFFEPAT